MLQPARFVLIAALLPCALPLAAETIPDGTKLVVRLSKELEREEGRKQTFSAEISSPVFVHGREAVPMGSRVEGEVRGSKKTIFLSPQYLVLPDGRKIDFNASVAGIDFKQLKTESKEGTIEEKGGHGGEAAQQAGEVGVMGAEIGAISTGSLAGAGIGAAAGVGAVLIGRKIAGRGRGTVIPAGSNITLNLNKPIDVPDDIADTKPAEIKSLDREDQRPILRRPDAGESNPKENTESHLLAAW
jgi:hypothetical protein